MNIWRLLNGSVDIAGITLWAAYYQVEDVELLIDSILYIRQRSG